MTPKRKRPHVSGPKPGYPGRTTGADDYDPAARVVKRKEVREIKTEIISMDDKPRITRELPKDPYLEAS